MRKYAFSLPFYSCISWCASALLALVPAAHAGKLNDTGMVTCYNTYLSTGTVSENTPAPVDSGYESQDCTRGATAADAVGVMSKHGASTTKGRDYTKIGGDGSELPASATQGPGATDWACTQDNITGLTWEIKTGTATDLRYSGHTYTWYDTDPSVNYGYAGTQAGTGCSGTLANCNTTAFRDAVNAGGLCGANDWRLPTRHELLSLMDFNSGIDAAYFPDAANDNYWTGITYAFGLYTAWVVGVGGVRMFYDLESNSYPVRLVRGGQ